VALDLLASIVVAGKRNVEAERLSRELVTTFSRAGVAVSVAQALAYLRDAIIERRAEESLVRYVERYFRRIEIDPHAAFAPEAAPRPPN
jgi:hypothetical protein